VGDLLAAEKNTDIRATAAWALSEPRPRPFPRRVVLHGVRVSPNRAIQSRSSSKPASRQRALVRRGGSSIGSSVSRKVPQWIPSMSGSGR